MSRVGKKPIELGKAKVSQNGSQVLVEGPAGKLDLTLHPRVSLEIDGGAKSVNVLSKSENKEDRAFQGLTRSLLQNMVNGVTEPFQKTLEIVGVGYGAQISGNKLTVNVGFANSVEVTVPPGVDVQLPDATHINIKGPDKQAVGQFAASVRKIRPPEPYKGKGIRYSTEEVKRKPGKAFVGGE